MSTKLADLDELALRCRDKRVGDFIHEAVVACKNGAFRSAIILTWNAVVLDYLAKLRELEMTGDAKAKEQIQRFETIRQGGEARLKDALDFEREMLKTAADDFQLLTPHEREDLERLQKDRGRCAHPSMQNMEEPYHPTPEQARMHLRNAVEVLLAREPVQGKAAFTRICDEIKSSYFPSTTDEAVAYFKSGPLVRARKILLKDLLVGLMKSYLNEDLTASEKLRQVSAIGAIIEMHRSIAEDIAKEYWPPLFDATTNDNLLWILGLFIRCPMSIELARPSVDIRIRNYLRDVTASSSGHALFFASRVDQYRDVATAQIESLTAMQLEKLLENARYPVFEDRAIRLYRQGCTNYSEVERLTKVLMEPLLDHFTIEGVEAIHAAVHENNQIRDARVTPRFLESLYLKTKEKGVGAGGWQSLMIYLTGHEAYSTSKEKYSRLRTALVTDRLWPL